MARAEALSDFSRLVERLGGNGDAYLTRFGIDPQVMQDANGLVPYRAMIELLEQAAVDFRCPEFGMKLAAYQGPFKVVGPLGVAIRNSRTLGDGLRYCADHVHVYSNAVGMSFERRADRTWFLRFEVLLERMTRTTQASEHALSWLQDSIPIISGDRVRARELWFTHERCAAEAAYKQYVGNHVRFCQPMSGLLFNEEDLDAPLANPDRQLYSLATTFIDQSFPSEIQRVSERVRTLIPQLLKEGECSQERISAELCMHPRTLQRRLKLEGNSFESIKDAVRRDSVLYYLGQSSLPLVQVAAALGYLEVSTLSRSCYRWFSVSPKRLRKALLRGETIEPVVSRHRH
jgi:AraC-like DNA-binding protein